MASGEQNRAAPRGIAPPPPGPLGEFDAPGQPFGIVAGPDGALWFTERSAGKIGRMTTDGALTEFSLPTAASGPSGIAAGPDDALWFTEQNANRIGRITTAGVVTEYTIPTAASGPLAIAAGPDSALWFTEQAANRIGRITTDGTITDFDIPTPGSSPGGIVAGNGSLWFTEQAAGKIGFITTDGKAHDFAIPTPDSVPVGVAAGPGGIWFTEQNANKIGVVSVYFYPSSPTDLHAVFQEFPVPTPDALPTGIALGLDGSLWFTEYGSNKIALIQFSFVEEFPLSTGANPNVITSRADGTLWFTDTSGKIGRAATSAQGCRQFPLCVADLRFGVEMSTRNSNGTSEFGQPMPLTPNAGAFSVYSPGNPEVVVKVLDGCSSTGHYWIFAAGLTNAQTTLRVTDTATGVFKTYVSPEGTPSRTIRDTGTFGCSALPAQLRAGSEPRSSP